MYLCMYSSMSLLVEPLKTYALSLKRAERRESSKKRWSELTFPSLLLAVMALAGPLAVRWGSP